MNFRERGGHFNPVSLLQKTQLSFPKRGKGGGGSEAVWKFSENSSKMVQVITPKIVVVVVHCKNLI